MLIRCMCKWESLFWKNHHTTKYSERCTSLYGCRLSQFSVPQIPFIWISDYLLYMKAIEHHLFCDNETKVARILIKTICTVVGYVKNGWGYGKSCKNLYPVLQDMYVKSELMCNEITNAYDDCCSTKLYWNIYSSIAISIRQYTRDSQYFCWHGWQIQWKTKLLKHFLNVNIYLTRVLNLNISPI